MVDPRVGYILMDKERYPITGYEVWWQSPFGCFQSLEDACDMFPEGTILEHVRGVPVAVCRQDGKIVAHEVLP